MMLITTLLTLDPRAAAKARTTGTPSHISSTMTNAESKFAIVGGGGT